MMAKITFKLSIFTVFISALLLLTQSGDTLATKLNRLNVEEQNELESGSLLMQMLIEAETKTLGLAKDVMEVQTDQEDANSKDQLKCIPCGAACISSRNCCRNCYCLIEWDLVIPRCVRVISANKKIKVAIENESGNLLNEIVKAGAVLQYDIHEEAMDEVSDETLSAKLKCTQCGRECSSWNDCCGLCGCVYNTCLYLPNKNSMLNSQ